MSLVFLEQYDEWISAVCMTQFTKPGTHLEQPSMLNNFFSRTTILCCVLAWEQKICGWGLTICQISSLSGPTCS